MQNSIFYIAESNIKFPSIEIITESHFFFIETEKHAIFLLIMVFNAVATEHFNAQPSLPSTRVTSTFSLNYIKYCPTVLPNFYYIYILLPHTELFMQ